MCLEIFRINSPADLEGSERTFCYFCLFDVMKSRKSCPQNANIKVSLYNLNTTYVIHKYTFCENFKAPRQVEGKIIHSFKHLMGFKHLNKHSTISFNLDKGVTCDTLSDILVSDTFQNDSDRVIPSPAQHQSRPLISLFSIGAHQCFQTKAM